MSRAERERMLCASLIFASRTASFTAKKAFKLLYALDVQNFRQTGHTVTGLQYTAHTPGPIPDDFSIELMSPRADMARLLRVTITTVAGKERHEIHPAPGAVVDDEPFTRVQLDVLQNLVATYRDSTHDQIDVGSFDNGAWQAALTLGKGASIDFAETLDPADPDRAYKLNLAAEYEARADYLRSLA